jgi:peptidoglycan/xylan/chitin deacetylase (PgdA/CDA1 family)
MVLLALMFGCPLALGAGASPARSGAPAPSRTHTARPSTIVSLEFDHAFTDQLPAIAIANRRRMHVTVFAMSGRVGLPGYMTASQLRELQAQGNEIGGHTIDHRDLSQLSPPAQHHEICDDRVALEADGLAVTDFAYPYGSLNASTPGIAHACGYQSARGAGGIASEGGCEGPCPAAETIPPHDPYHTRAVNSIIDTTTLSTMTGYVRAAERHGGGWVQIVFHHVCDGCDLYAISPQTIAQFIAWLAHRSAIGTRVQTVRQVIHTPFAPGPIRVRLASGVALGLRPAVRCPSTPVGAGCTRRSVPSLTVPTTSGAGSIMTVSTSSPARIVLLDIFKRLVRATAIGRAGLRWRLRLPPSTRSRRAMLKVSYPLGLADYPLRLSRS